MLPGVSFIEQVEALKKGDKKSIILDGKGKASVAVVSSLIDKEYIDSNGMKGKGFKSIHFLGDSLWLLGSQTLPPLIEGTSSGLGKMEEANSKRDLNENSNEGKDEKIEEISLSLSSQTLAQKLEQDELIDYCFTYTAKNYFKGEHLKELPMLYNIFWVVMSNVPCRPLRSTHLDIKKSKWKKLSVFLEEKMKENIVQVEEKKEGVFQIVSIDKAHPSLVGFRGDLFSEEELSENVAILAEREGDQVNEKIEIIEMFKAPSLLFPLFQEQGKRKEDLYDISQVREAISAYIATHNLTVEKSKQNVVLDILLAGIVLKKGEYKETISKKDLNEIIINKMQPHYILKIGDDNSEIRKGSPGPINITLEDRQQRKHITHIFGLESFGINPNSVSSEFNKLFAASTTVQQLPGKTAGKEVLIQGDFVKEIATYIIEKYSIPKKYLQASHKGKTININ
eukprot:TRINITY_DN2241_c0_g1_i1.p1 TRINITY_DN2241_c0_g1~~TRINITY_DN2241_c0_g1_i1.p1  ORF type:complete len:453 (+),score=112.17 TRINITY_DN2241_c0_g1_i1:539-1897(+)